jgi:hypothetical protein
MTDVDAFMEMDAGQTGKDTTKFSWRRELLQAVAMVTAFVGVSFLTSWYMGRDIRPLMLAGFLLYMTAAFALGMRRRWRNAKHPQTSADRGKFSLAELLIFVTGLAFFIGLSAADHLKAQQFWREREQLQVDVASVLGADGRITFQPDGSLQIAICDRTFDDARLARLAEMISQRKSDTNISGIMFGSGANTNSTPPVWPGITDQSIALLIEWRELEMLSVYGTAISDNGREQLRSLPHLNEPSRWMLAK